MPSLNTEAAGARREGEALWSSQLNTKMHIPHIRWEEHWQEGFSGRRRWLLWVLTLRCRRGLHWPHSRVTSERLSLRIPCWLCFPPVVRDLAYQGSCGRSQLSPAAAAGALGLLPSCTQPERHAYLPRSCIRRDWCGGTTVKYLLCLAAFVQELLRALSVC